MGEIKSFFVTRDCPIPGWLYKYSQPVFTNSGLFLGYDENGTVGTLVPYERVIVIENDRIITMRAVEFANKYSYLRKR